MLVVFNNRVLFYIYLYSLAVILGIELDKIKSDHLSTMTVLNALLLSNREDEVCLGHELDIFIVFVYNIHV